MPVSSAGTDDMTTGLGSGVLAGMVIVFFPLIYLLSKRQSGAPGHLHMSGILVAISCNLLQ